MSRPGFLAAAAAFVLTGAAGGVAASQTTDSAVAATPRVAFVYVNAFCESCEHEAPYVRRAIDRRPGVRVVVVGFRMTRPETVDFARRLRFPKAWSVVGDPNGTRSDRDRVCKPTAIVIRRGSRVVERIDAKYPGEPASSPATPC